MVERNPVAGQAPAALHAAPGLSISIVRPPMPSVYIETYGCQMNVADTELMRGQLARSGYTAASDPAAADVILLNTCAIREHAEERIFGRLGALAQHKLRRPHVQIGLAGCMAQHFRDRLLDRTPHLDFVVGPDAYRRLPALLSGDPFVDVRLDRDETYADVAPERGGGVRAWITVMRGCDKFCTFCIVPYVRGRERSVPAQAVLAQVRDVAGQGYREVVFLGQTVNAYRDGDTDFGALLAAANAVEGIARLRFTSPHPSDMGESAIRAMAECEKVAPQLHLPLQSGSTAVLERMERGYSVDEYLCLVERLRAAVPGLALSTDVIVGFPGESEADFAATLEVMRAVRFDSAFMFKYSRRDHTKAGKWDETVSENEKADRLQAVIALQEAIAAEINRSLIGADVEVLVDGPARRRAGWLAGKTPQFKTVVFRADGSAPGDLVRVRVAHSTAHTLIGK
jgi:tRNA-2-methylthio-N6-dimethylallyladenosine synthase